MPLEKTLRWFGPEDQVKLEDIRQTGATGIVTALHHVPNGSVWSEKEIKFRKLEIEKAGLHWHVVESLPVHHLIKAGLTGRDQYISNYKASLKNLARCGIDTVCYNFMPVLDWVRTDLKYLLSGNEETMLFDLTTFALFDIHILKREQAEADYSDQIVKAASRLFSQTSQQQLDELASTIILVTQGFIDGFTNSQNQNYIEEFKNYLKEYENIDADQLRSNLFYFLEAILPTAEKVGVKMAIHADDPAFPVLGLPRIVSTEEDLKRIFAALPSRANGLTFCTGSFSTNKSNHIIKMAAGFLDRIHFLHLRNTKFIGSDTFIESGHLEGDVDMVGVIKTVLKSGRQIPMRPDHGLKILTDQTKQSNPGYPLTGRLKGLAEIAGIEAALLHLHHE